MTAPTNCGQCPEAKWRIDWVCTAADRVIPEDVQVPEWCPLRGEKA